jgi:hypothetical protein
METIIQFLSVSGVFLLILNRGFNAALTEHMTICCRVWIIINTDMQCSVVQDDDT